MSTPRADIGLIGLAVMGQNIVLNMNDHGYTVAVFNRTVSKVDEFLASEAAGTHVGGAPRARDHAGRIRRGMASREGDLPVNCREDGRRGALLRLGRRRRRRAL